MSATAEIARFAAETRWQDLPAAAQAESRRALLNWFGCALGGSTAPAVATLRDAMAMPGPAWIAGASATAEPGAAALLNGFAASHDCYDDTHLATVIHPTAPIVAAALAAAAGRRVSGAALLTALAVGDEIACRVGLAVMTGPNPASLGWYMTGIVGCIGSAASAGRLLGLDAGQMVSALGFGVAQAAGLRAAHASVASPLVPGLAARSGYSAALFASLGMTCHDGALESQNGLLPTMAPGNPLGPLTAALGARYAFLDLAYKPYPCGVAVHPTIDGCLEIGRMDPEAIERIEVTVDPLAARLCLRTDVDSSYDAQVSIPHWCAAALVFCAAGVPESRAVAHPAVLALRERVVAIPDETLARDQARVLVLLRDGRRLAADVVHASGSLANPLAPEALARKARDQAVPVLGADRAEALLERLGRADALEDIATLLP